MNKIPTKTQITSACKPQPWDFGNKILYDLCKKSFNHEHDEEIIAKVLFIGRIYAAAVERGKKKKNNINDNFYIKTIAPAFKRSQLDKKLEQLKTSKKITPDNISSILSTHQYLISELNKVIDREKRSFSSKYLHFHLPELFFIYDSRVVSALRQFVSRIPKELEINLPKGHFDNEYYKFYVKCFYLKTNIESNYKIKMTNRQFDNFLISIANQNMVKREK